PDGRKASCLVKIGDRVSPVAPLLIHVPPVDVSGAPVGISLDRPGEVLEGLVVLAAVQIVEPAVVERAGPLGPSQPALGDADGPEAYPLMDVGRREGAVTGAEVG